MRSKKAVSAIMVGIIALLVVFVLLLNVQSAMIALIRGSGEDMSCVWSAVMNAHSGGLLTLGSKGAKLKCPMRSVYITEDAGEVNPETLVVNLNRGQTVARAKIEEFTGKFGDRIAGPNNNGDIQYPYGTGEEDVKLWLMDKTIADQMKSCWKKLGQGQLPLFSQDITGIELTSFDEGILKSLNFPKLETNIPIGCVICSRIKFDESVTTEFGGGKITSIDAWLKTNPISKTDMTSYYEYLQDDYSSDFFAQSFQYSVDEPQAVVFARAVLPLLDDYTDWLPGDNDENDETTEFDMIYLVPYDEVGDYCTVLMN